MRAYQDAYAKMEADGTVARIKSGLPNKTNSFTSGANALNDTQRIAMPFTGGTGGGGMSKQQYRSMSNTEGEQVANTANAMLGSLNAAPAKPEVNTGLNANTGLNGTANAMKTNTAPLGSIPGATPTTKAATVSDNTLHTYAPKPANTSATPAYTTPTSAYAAPTLAVNPSTNGDSAHFDETYSILDANPDGQRYDPYKSYGTNDRALNDRKTLKSIADKYGGEIYSVDTTTMSNAEYKQYEKDVAAYQALYGNIEDYDREMYNTELEEREKKAFAEYQRLLTQKYLGDTIKAMGLSNTGAGANVALHLNAQYDNAVKDIQNNVGQTRNEVYAYYKDALDKFNAQQRETELAEQNTQRENYNTFYNSISQGDPDFDLSLLDSALNAGDINQAQYDRLKSTYDQTIGADRKHTAQEWSNGIKVTRNMLTKYVEDSNITGKTFKATGKQVEAENVRWADTVAENANGLAWGAQGKLVKEIKAAAIEGSLPNGTIVDFDLKKGTDYWVYIDGVFYQIKEA